MAVYHPLRSASVRVTVVVLCLLVVNGFAIRLPPAAARPLSGQAWLALGGSLPPTGTGLLAGGVCVTRYVRRAVSRVEDERASVEAERDAFREFADAVGSIDADGRAPTGRPAATLVSPEVRDAPTETVRDAYRRTVMDTPDYERAYGESIGENMTAELGPEVAGAVLRGERFGPQLKRALRDRAAVAATQRRAFLNALDGERDSLSEARRRIESTAVPFGDASEADLSGQSFGTLVGYDRQLRRSETRCRELLEDRQREIHRADGWLPDDGGAGSLQEYLYRRLDATFPVLRAAAERIERLRDRRRAVVRAVVRAE